MGQVSYGTITITDTNDIEEIYMIYAGSSGDTQQDMPTWTYAAVTGGSIWKRNVSQVTGDYIWQSTVITKSGVTVDSTNWQNFYNTPICITGPEGQDGKGISSITIQYCNYGTGTPADTGSHWQDTIPAYDSSKPNYWTKTTIAYTTGNPFIKKVLDQGITQAIYNSAMANSIAQSANENANGAMGQAAANIQTITRVWYAKANSTTPAAPTSHVTVSSATTYNTWNIKRPNSNDSYPYYFYCDETCTGGGTYSWSEIVLDTSNLSQYQIGLLDAQVKNFWWDSTGAHIASGIGGNNVDKETISTYGYNALVALSGISFRYNNAKAVDLNSSTPSLDFYKPPTISGSTVTEGTKTMSLTSNALNFYGSSVSTADATLTSTGLKLVKGGLEAGSKNTSDYIYIWSNDDATNHKLTINNHEASDWRIVAGNRFGVDKAGNLYANNAEISGKITASSLTIGSGAIVSGLSTSNISGINDYALQSSLDTEVAQRKAVYAVSTTGATTAAKTTESGTPSGFVLYNGATVTVKFNSANSTTTPTLNVNGTGAKTIKSYTGVALSAAEYTWPAGAAITFTYDGSYWRMQDGGALQAKADAAASASNASSDATAASNSATAANNAKTAAESAKTAAQTAQSAAETASGQATTAKNDAVSAKTAAQAAQTAAETAKGQAQTAASNASQSETNAAASATAAAEVMGGFTILWNYSAFGTATAGDAFICGFDPATGTKSDASGWVKWNGAKRTITKQQINPGTIVPYNIPIYIVCRLSSATATTGTNYMVWYNVGWKYAACPSPTAVGGSWTWTDNRDIILGSFVETGENEVLTECELFNPPWTSKQITTNTTTPTSYIMDTDSNKGITVKPKDSSGNDFLQMNSTAIEFFRNSTTTSVMRLTDSSFRLGLEASNHTTIDTNGLHIWAGTESTATNEIAQFGDDIILGRGPNQGEAYLKLDYHSLKAIDSSQECFFSVEDIANNVGEITEIFKGDGEEDVFTPSGRGRLLSCTINGESVGWETIDGYDHLPFIILTNSYQLDEIPPNNSEIIFKYIPQYKMQGYTLGTRLQDYNTALNTASSYIVGSRSTCIGELNIASNWLSYAEGYYNIVQGKISHAEGGENKILSYLSHAEGWNNKILSGDYSHINGRNNIINGGGVTTVMGFGLMATESIQTIIGKYNNLTLDKKSGNYAFIIGNGTGEDSRSNALTVDWDGNITATGNYYTKNSSLSLGACVVGGYMTNNSGSIVFSIPTGRVYPTGTTINKISFNIVARAGNSNSTGTYIIKSSSGGSSPVSFSSTSSSTFYNGANVSKTLTTAMWRTKELQGGTNIYLVLGTDDTTAYFFSSSSINSQINNQPLGIYLGDIQVTFNIPVQV